MTTENSKHFVELNNVENNLIKAAFMTMLGVANGNEQLALMGTMAGVEIIKAMGDNYKAFVEKMKEHAKQTDGDGTYDEMKSSALAFLREGEGK